MMPSGHNCEGGEQRVLVRTSSRRAAASFVDAHCHCLPYLDDGPASAEEAVALCRALVEDQVRTVVATPHQLGRFDGRTSAGKIRLAVQLLSRKLGELGIDLKVLPGAEVRLDERLIAGGAWGRKEVC